MSSDIWLAGVDGCRHGWVAAFWRPASGDVAVRVVPRFADVLAAPERPAIIAVDMPIGLPEWIGPSGRGPESAVRPLLGKRKSSVFPVPSRHAIYAKDYDEARRIAAATSDPPRKATKQLFAIAPKIREIDALLRADAAAVARVREVHPEVAFWRLNGERALDQPKKVKGRRYEPGLALRRRLLVGVGIAEAIACAPPPAGAAADDLIDALACAVIARRVHAGGAQSFPRDYGRDAFGLPIAIWA